MPRDVLVQIIEPRAEEIFSEVHHVLCETGYTDLLASGAVICGGSTLLDGMPELAEQILGIPVRRAAPIGVGGLADVVRSPMFATAVGLVKYGARRIGAKNYEEVPAAAVTTNAGIGSRLGGWFREVF